MVRYDATATARGVVTGPPTRRWAATAADSGRVPSGSAKRSERWRDGLPPSAPDVLSGCVGGSARYVVTSLPYPARYAVQTSG